MTAERDTIGDAIRSGYIRERGEYLSLTRRGKDMAEALALLLPLAHFELIADVQRSRAAGASPR